MAEAPKKDDKPADDKVEMSRADYNLLRESWDTLNKLWSSPKHSVAARLR